MIKSNCRNGNLTVGNWDHYFITPKSRHTKSWALNLLQEYGEFWEKKRLNKKSQIL